MPKHSVRNTIGFLMQFAALIFLPLLIFWQLDFGFRLLWMPTLTVAAVAVFWIGHQLRDKS